jgi:hypothetical protein
MTDLIDIRLALTTALRICGEQGGAVGRRALLALEEVMAEYACGSCRRVAGAASVPAPRPTGTWVSSSRAK